MQEVIERVLPRIVPLPEEEAELREVEKALIARVDEAARLHDRRLYSRLLGSASRGTWLRYEKDLDVFIFFPEEYTKQEMERVVSSIASEVLVEVQKRYAEHPYVRGRFMGYEVELVPCYAIREPSRIRSAVDRTPFHNDYVRGRIGGLENEVRLLKQFLRGIGCYGAEAKVEGFSGYLCELLVLRFGSFQRVLQSAATWKPGVVLALGEVEERAARRRFSSPLIFIDPVDENRNVAGALSLQRFSEFVYASKCFLRKPAIEYFFPPPRKVSREELLGALSSRGTALVGVRFEAPDVVEDVLYPQLRKAHRLLRRQLEAGGFRVLGGTVHAGRNCHLVFELLESVLPAARLHLGPPVNSSHEERFLGKYREELSRPFILNGRWAVFTKRRHGSAAELLRDFLSGGELHSKGVPKHLAMSIQEHGFEVVEGEECLEEEALLSVAEYLLPLFPWERGSG